MENNILDEEDKSSVGYHLSEILKKYGLEEEEEKSFEKLEKDEPLNGEILSEICSNLAKNLISETDAILSIQKKLNIAEGISKEIISDIKNIILPQLKEILAKRYNSNINKNAPDVSEVALLKNLEAPTKRIKKYPKNLEQPEEENKFPKKITEQKILKQNGADRYREPVE